MLVNLSTEDKPIKKKAGRPKKGSISDNEKASKYLQLCKEGKTLSEIAAAFDMDEESFKKLPEAQRSKLKSVWKLGQTYFKAYHEALYKHMLANKKDFLAFQVTGQKELLTVYIKDWNIKKETKVTVTNKWETMSEKDIDRELQSTLKRKNTKNLVIDVLGLNNDDSESASTKPH